MKRQATIHILNEYTAKQIAAGEVIERPACVVRELIDNSIDAGAKNIEVQLVNGGVDSICVSDDGVGMSAEDLVLCCRSHATSKIREADDLLVLSSMGFRGEALASISAISTTTITSFDSVTQRAHEIIVEGDVISPVRSVAHNKGTRICVDKLFHAIPVRKKFLSSISAERMRVKNTIVEKAAAFPDIAFRLKEGTENIVHIPREDAFVRAVRVSNQVDTRMFVWHDSQQSAAPLQKGTEKTEGMLQVQAALGLADIAVRTRKHIHLYVNKRPVRSFQITQAVEYAYKDIIHTGAFPQAVVFVTIVPSEVDVNVHPSKQEVRIKPMAKLRSLIIRAINTALETQTRAMPQYHVENNTAFEEDVTAIKDVEKAQVSESTSGAEHTEHKLFSGEGGRVPYTSSVGKTLPKKHSGYMHRNIAPASFTTAPQRDFTHAINTPSLQALSEGSTSYNATTASAAHKALFIGCAFATYAVFETGEALLFLDFHATHERQLFDSLLADPKPQPLVVPVPLVLDMAEEERSLAIEAYNGIGIIIEQQGKKDVANYTLSEVPQVLYTRASTLASLIDETNYGAEGVNIELFARKACKGAVKAGDHIDSQNAHALLTYAQKLTRSRCPHGRPLWACIAKSSLDSMIGRTA